jgi:hypothetical protein
MSRSLGASTFGPSDQSIEDRVFSIVFTKCRTGSDWVSVA